MFGVANCLADDFDRFSHGLVTFLRSPETNAAPRAFLVFARTGFVGNRRTSAFRIRPITSVVIQYFLKAVFVLMKNKSAFVPGAACERKPLDSIPQKT
jgi:hypothetical protein